MSKVKSVQTFNKSLFTSMSQFEPKRRENGKTTLGTGSFGSVQLNQHLSTNQLYAIKIIQGTNITTPYEVDGIEREIKVHSKCSHQNIVKLYDSFQENDCVYIVLEYLPNGNLYNYIQKKKKLDEREACKYFIQTCHALQYLHDMNVFHRDIKPENLLLDANYNLKLCDFGWCAENIHLKRKTFCGTYEYMAPEIVSDVAYDYTIDIWSVGVLLYELLHGFAPFKGKEYKEIAANIKLGQVKFASFITPEAQELINCILQRDPTSRPSFQQIYNSTFVQKNWGGIIKSISLKVDVVGSPRLSHEGGPNNYQSPFQQHIALKPRTLDNANNTTEKIQSQDSTKVVEQKLKSPKLEVKAAKRPLISESTKLLQESKSCKSTIQNCIDEVKKKLDFDSVTTPLKDNTSKFQNSHTSSTLNFGSKGILTSQDENYSHILRKKTINTTSFFCSSTQNSGKKGIFTSKDSDKKAIPKSQILLAQPSDKKLNTLSNQSSLAHSKLTTQVTKLNLKSKSGYYGIHNENINGLSESFSTTQKKLSFASTKNTARKEQKKTILDQYISLPSEATMINKDDQLFQDETLPTMTERPNDPTKLKNKQESKNDFDRLLRMYMSLCGDKKQCATQI